MTNHHILTIKFVGPTNTQKKRVKIISELFGESVIIPWHDAIAATFGGITAIAEHWLKENGFYIVGEAEGKGHNYIITDTFKSPKSL